MSTTKQEQNTLAVAIRAEIARYNRMPVLDVHQHDAVRWLSAALPRAVAAEALAEAAERAVGAIEAVAVHEAGGPPLYWPAMDQTADARRSALRRYREGGPS